MSWAILVISTVAAFLVGEVLARQRSSRRAVTLSTALLVGLGVIGTYCSTDALLPVGPALVAVLAIATILSRPISGMQDLVYPLVVFGAAVRMAIVPFAPLLMTNYDRLPLGRAGLVAAIRPSVPLVLVVRDLGPMEVLRWAEPFQIWAAIAAVLAAVQGIVQRDLRRGLGAMATTQSAILLYGLVSPRDVGVAVPSFSGLASLSRSSGSG